VLSDPLVPLSYSTISRTGRTRTSDRRLQQSRDLSTTGIGFELSLRRKYGFQGNKPKPVLVCSEVPDIFTTWNSIVCVRMNCCSRGACDETHRVCEPKAHPDHRWTVRKSVRRSLRRAPRFASRSHALSVSAITRIRVSSARFARALKALHVWRRH